MKAGEWGPLEVGKDRIKGEGVKGERTLPLFLDLMEEEDEVDLEDAAREIKIVPLLFGSLTIV
jgi:hypothetical protein